MPQPRYQVLGLEKHGGRTVVRVEDRVVGTVMKVYRKGTRYLRWDARDLAVTNQSVQRVVREALEGIGVS